MPCKYLALNCVAQFKGKCTELTLVNTPYILYYALKAILRMFKLFPKEFVSTFNVYIALHSDKISTYSISNAIAVASPPPIQREAIPLDRPLFFNAWIKVTIIRAPLAPKG